MTRGKWVALAVGLAVIAVVVLNGPAVWRVVAYTPAREEPVVVLKNGRTKYTPYTHTGPIEFRNAMTFSGNGGTHTMRSRLSIKKKRHVWIPGVEFIFPDQVCPWCRFAYSHESCFRRRGRASDANCALRDGTRVDPPMTFRCTCPDSSHAQDSE